MGTWRSWRAMQAALVAILYLLTTIAEAQEIHSGYPTRFASPYIMRLLKRGGVDYEVRLMKRDGGGLAVVEMVKRGENEEEANGEYGIRMMKKRIAELNDQKIFLWRGKPYSIEMPKQGGVDAEAYEIGMMRRRREPYGVRMMKRAEDSGKIIKKESEPYGFRLMKRADNEEDLDDDGIRIIKKEGQPYGIRMMKRANNEEDLDDDGTRIIKKEGQPYGIRMMKRESSSGKADGSTRIIKKENEAYGLRLIKRENAGYGIRMMRRGERAGYGIRMMKAKLGDDME